MVDQGQTSKKTRKSTQNGKAETGKRYQKSLSKSQDDKKNIKDSQNKSEEIL